MVTSIQLNEDVKNELDKLKIAKETYEDVILNLMRISEQHKRKQKELLIEGYKEMTKDSLRICKEFEHSDSDLDWEWNEDGY